LLALYEAGQILSSSLEREEIGAKLLEITQRVFDPTAAVIDLRDGERLRVWRTVGPEDVLDSVRNAPGAEAARRATLITQEHRSFELDGSRPERLVGLILPLRVRDRTIGLLEVYGRRTLTDNEVVGTCASLANQAASALENARLYEELTQREQQLHELVGKLLTAQEEERRRVAYDVHDGLAQMVAAAYQHLQGFARHHPPASPRGRDELEETLELVRTTVGETRQVISHLRPTTLDDFGLAAAIQQQVSSLRAEGRRVEYVEALGTGRLPAQVETTLFRVAQEAMTNIRKHAGPATAHVALERLDGAVRLLVQDEGSGFRPTDPLGGDGPGERVGLSGMRERVLLLGGRFDVLSDSGAGTSVIAEVPLPSREEEGGDGQE
jgi:signal transduction histidine kinase